MSRQRPAERGGDSAAAGIARLAAGQSGERRMNPFVVPLDFGFGVGVLGFGPGTGRRWAASVIVSPRPARTSCSPLGRVEAVLTRALGQGTGKETKRQRHGRPPSSRCAPVL